MFKKLFLVLSCLLTAQTLYSQGQFAGFYAGQVFLKSIASGVESDEILQREVNLTINNQGKLVSQGVAFLTGQVDAGGNITFDLNGFFFELEKVEGAKLPPPALW